MATQFQKDNSGLYDESDSDINIIIGLPIAGMICLAMISPFCVIIWRSKRNTDTGSGTVDATDPNLEMEPDLAQDKE